MPLSMAEILAAIESCPPQEPCPPPPLETVCGEAGYIINLKQWPVVEDHLKDPDAVLSMHLSCEGEMLVGERLVGCLKVTTHNVSNAQLISEKREALPTVGECLPVPEPSFALSLVLGLFALSCAARSRRASHPSSES